MPGLRIDELTAFRVRIELRQQVRHASFSRTETESLLVRCRLNDGSIGWGEGLPREYVTGETCDQAWDLLCTADLTSQLGGTWSGMAEAMARLSQLQLNAPDPDGRGCFGNSARCALELALLDALCRAERIPLSHVTKLIPETEPFRQQSDHVRYSVPFTAMSVRKQITRALKLRLAGFRQVKVKTGVVGVDDVALLRRLRRWLGSRFDLRIDANEAWTCAELPRRLEELAPFGITSVEQPVPHAAIDGLAEIRHSLPIPVMFDESLCSAADARRAIEQRLCDLFNIRLSKCGGFLPSLKLLAQARQAGLGAQLGCQVGETGILSAAGRHFATSVTDLRAVEGSYDRYLVRERLTKEDLTFGWGGYAPALTGPGLGIHVDEAAVRRVTLQERTIFRDGA